MKKSAFTLIELLIVIAIIGILISIGVASYAQAQIKSRNARRQGDMKAAQSAIEQYYADNNGQYPPNGTCDALTTTTKYLPAGLPQDPKHPALDYTFSCPSVTNYCFCGQLEPAGNTSGNASNTSCVYESGKSGDSYFCVSNLQ
ncbi:MAG TPA: prepilin-type N-terminal cleavage/methylation domain-containing protein [Patescibacteria group bacterium]|jgi:prepilin-type N-terminal cleavage/methylation domain-containing protein|nr:prepilin-type N-terminal cleavage/methylation domain-containing protein [Patescibacteria group bacterium]